MASVPLEPADSLFVPLEALLHRIDVSKDGRLFEYSFLLSNGMPRRKHKGKTIKFATW